MRRRGGSHEFGSEMNQERPGQENNYAAGNSDGTDVDTATPPLCPGTMPTQVIEFWTLALVSAAVWHLLTGLWRPPQADREAAISAVNTDEPG
jgi:hypothetical protein